MDAAGLGVNGVDVTGVGKYTASGAAAAGKVNVSPPPPAAPPPS